MGTPYKRFNMADMDIIKINVGGQVFKTRIDTLKRFQDSMLAKMFEHTETGMAPMPKDENGDFFLDQDPEDFKIILKFLRLGSEVLDETSVSKSVLHLADYLGLPLTLPVTQPEPKNALITFELKNG